MGEWLLIGSSSTVLEHAMKRALLLICYCQLLVAIPTSLGENFHPDRTLLWVAVSVISVTACYLGRNHVSSISYLPLMIISLLSIDYYPRDGSPTNFLFRGNMPAINGSFAYKQLLMSMSAAAAKHNITLPTKLTLIDVRWRHKITMSVLVLSEIV